MSLGVPPLRTGGMTRYCIELARAQAGNGDAVSLLFPGRFLPGKTRIQKGRWNELFTYEVINPLPVPLVYGVSEPSAFIADCNNIAAYKQLLETVVPDIIHVHSFQGIHREFFLEAKKLDYPMVYTTHDYYPICPRCTLINSKGEECEEGPSPARCLHCNINHGMSYKKSVVMQSALYARMKESKFVRWIGAKAKGTMVDESDKTNSDTGKRERRYDGDLLKAYSNLLKYNIDVFNTFDLVITNSSVTKGIYSREFPESKYKLLPITHDGLYITQRQNKARKQKITVSYFGGSKIYKGIEILAEASEILDYKNIPVRFMLYGDDYSTAPKVHNSIINGRISPKEVDDAILNSDLVVVPSIYHETFCFVVLEALVRGVQVICSDVVGAKDLLDSRWIFKSGNSGDLALKIEEFIQCAEDNSFCTLDGYPLSMRQQASCLEEYYRSAKGGEGTESDD